MNRQVIEDIRIDTRILEFVKSPEGGMKRQTLFTLTMKVSIESHGASSKNPFLQNKQPLNSGLSPNVVWVLFKNTELVNTQIIVEEHKRFPSPLLEIMFR